MSTTNNFYGDITNSQIQQNTQNSAQTITLCENYDKKDELLNWLNTTFKDNLPHIELENSKLDIIENSVQNINSELLKHNSKSSVVKECISTIRNLLEGITGSVIASGLIHQLGLFL